MNTATCRYPATSPPHTTTQPPFTLFTPPTNPSPHLLRGRQPRHQQRSQSKLPFITRTNGIPIVGVPGEIHRIVGGNKSPVSSSPARKRSQPTHRRPLVSRITNFPRHRRHRSPK